LISLAQRVSIYVLEQIVVLIRIEDEISDYLDRFCKNWNVSQPLYAGVCLVAKLKRRIFMSR
jgi:hypothetical protein